VTEYGVKKPPESGNSSYWWQICQNHNLWWCQMVFYMPCLAIHSKSAV